MKDSFKPSNHHKAKMELLQHMRSMAMDMIHEGHQDVKGEDLPGPNMPGVKKMVNDTKSSRGLDTSIEKAKEMAQGGSVDEESIEGENQDKPDHSQDDFEVSEHEHDEDSPEAIQAKIEHLKAKLAKHSK